MSPRAPRHSIPRMPTRSLATKRYFWTWWLFPHLGLQRIRGYKNLSINLWYTSASFVSYGSLSFSERRERADDVVTILGEFMKLDTRALPTFTAATSQPFVPPGQELKAASKDDLCVFVAQPATDPAAAAYHSRLQVFTLWFVDGARYIELDDSRWRVFYLFQRCATPQGWRLLGFITTYVCLPSAPHVPRSYSFYAYDRVKLGKQRLRVSQVLIFPPYQRHGYGRFLYSAICNQARSDEFVQDITVEDPNADFSRLRDLCGMSLHRIFFSFPLFWLTGVTRPRGGAEASLFSSLSVAASTHRGAGGGDASGPAPEQAAAAARLRSAALARGDG